MAINRLQASLAQATNEITVAAANINFDFTLVKYEAPKEYQVLGNNLSSKRKHDAELGSSHVTARRLGALFQGVCPSTPKLVKAYGSRVSEIAEAAKKKSASDSAGIFAAHSGVDGTSIWAAATSSVTALHVQLLACMLARFWSAPEATATWVELIKERKKDIARRYEDEEVLPFAMLTAAAQSDIARSQLAEWDASARAWLRTADSIKTREQDQLMLILANVNIPVNNDMKVYSSVITTWKSALESMERLVGGMPQAINTCGPTMLALSAWHLYPDLLVVGHKQPEIQMRDPLVAAGGVLTVGLGKPGDEDHRGVYWSLSLAHLRHYGHPVETKRRLDHESGRVTFSQFTQAVFGCVLGIWGLTGTDIAPASRFFIALDNALQKQKRRKDRGLGGVSDDGMTSSTTAREYFKESSHWLHLMADAAHAYLDAISRENGTARQLVNLGLRRSSKFIKTRDLCPYFGLCQSPVVFSCLKGSEARIAYLRYVAAKLRAKVGSSAIIRYFESVAPGSSGGYRRLVRYATAIPGSKEHDMRECIGGNMLEKRRHCRWFSRRSDVNVGSLPVGEYWTLTAQRDFAILGLGWQTLDDGPGSIKTFRRRMPSGDWSTYHFIFGDFNAGIFSEKSRDRGRICIDVADLEWCLQSDAFSLDKLLARIDDISRLRQDVLPTMRALSAAATVYKLIPAATLAITVLDRPLAESHWASYMAQETQNTFGLTLPAALSCVAYLESGFCDIQPSLLTNVVALSSEDSLYISMQLLCDPYETPQPYELKRILGNVGKPGITMLVTPQNPMIREKNPASWTVMNDDAFNGFQEDHFGKTSLHLSFTDYHVPLFDGYQGGQDSQVSVLESVVSVHDSGSWIGDVDILGALAHGRIQRMIPDLCDHHGAAVPTQRRISIECWDNVLDPPQTSFVVRANGNWVSRLALTAILVQNLNKTASSNIIMLCPPNVCWRCNDQPSREKKMEPKESPHIYIY